MRIAGFCSSQRQANNSLFGPIRIEQLLKQWTLHYMSFVRHFYPKRHIQYCGQSPQEHFGVTCLRDTTTCWLQWDSNLLPPDSKSSTLPTEPQHPSHLTWAFLWKLQMTLLRIKSALQANLYLLLLMFFREMNVMFSCLKMYKGKPTTVFWIELVLLPSEEQWTHLSSIDLLSLYTWCWSALFVCRHAVSHLKWSALISSVVRKLVIKMC